MYRKVPVSQATQWIRQSWVLFKDSPGLWIGLSSLLITANLLPIIHQAFGVASVLLSTVIMCGIYFAVYFRIRGLPVSFNVLKFVFEKRENTRKIFLFCTVSILIDLFFMMLQLQVIPERVMEKLLTDHLSVSMAEKLPLFWIIIGSWAVKFILMFALPLYILQNQSLKNAIYFSCCAILTNTLPILTYTLLLSIVGGAFVVLTLGAGFVLFMPVALISGCISFFDICPGKVSGGNQHNKDDEGKSDSDNAIFLP